MSVRQHLRSPPQVALGFSVVIATLACRESPPEQPVTTVTSGGEVSTTLAGDSPFVDGVAMVRVVNAFPMTTGIRVATDRAQSFQSVEFKKVTAYIPVRENWVEFNITRGGQGTDSSAALSREMLADGKRYTLVVLRGVHGLPGVSPIEARVLRDELDPKSDRAKVRFIHAAIDVGKVSMRLRGAQSPIFADLDRASEAGFKTTAPLVGTLEVRTTEGGRLVAALPGTKLEAGNTYTFVLTRDAGGKVTLFSFEDRSTVGADTARNHD
jgi:hypothetical protein